MLIFIKWNYFQSWMYAHWGKHDTHPGSSSTACGEFFLCMVWSLLLIHLFSHVFPNGLHQVEPCGDGQAIFGPLFVSLLIEIHSKTNKDFYKSAESQTSFMMIMKMGQHRQVPSSYLKEEQRPDSVSFILFTCMLLTWLCISALGQVLLRECRSPGLDPLTRASPAVRRLQMLQSHNPSRPVLSLLERRVVIATRISLNMGHDVCIQFLRFQKVVGLAMPGYLDQPLKSGNYRGACLFHK
ncbi:hypothetical protein F5Y11DRAFT_32903 [Daldinia sp. FL1419]|nr:hypothetical protein F5Y11DRAFT_32903 [Daldinia sp. FL1419]